MDELKIVLYIVVAIIWVVYNNYKKISETSKKRDFTKPPTEVIQENWPQFPQQTKRRDVQIPADKVEKKRPAESRKVLERQPLPQRRPVRKSAIAVRQPIISAAYSSPEGGTISPSKIVHFEEQAVISEEPNALISALRNMDIRQAFIWSEVLKRPYT